MTTAVAADVRPLLIPPAGLRFRLVVKYTGQVLYAYRNGGVNGELKSGVTEAEPVNGNQFWRLILIGDQYVIASDIDDGLAMYVDNSNSLWYLSNQLSSHGSSVAFRQVSVDDGWFRIINSRYNTKCYMRTHREPFLGTVGADTENYDDQVFRFELDDVHVVRPIQYHLHSASILSQQKVELASQTVNNYGNMAQSQNLCYSKAKSYFQSFDSTSGSTIGRDTTFEVGVPYVTNGEIGVSALRTQVWHWGQSVTDTTTVECVVPISTPPHRQYRFTSYITEGQLSIPYTITLRSRKFGHTVTNSGVATAVATWDSYTNIQDMGPAVSDRRIIDDNIEGGGDNRTGGGEGED